MLPSTYFIIAGNLLPLFMCGLGYWSVNQVLPLYWSESAIVGLFTVLKIMLAAGPIMKIGAPRAAGELTPQDSIPGGPYSALALGGKFMLAAFFTFHFGMFMFVHGVFLFGLVLQGFHMGPAKVDPLSPALWLSYLRPVKWGIFSLFCGHAASFFLNYLKGGEYRSARPDKCMLQPYPRIVVMHLTILAGAFVSFAMAGRDGSQAIFIFVALKIFMDARAHLKEHASA